MVGEHRPRPHHGLQRRGKPGRDRESQSGSDPLTDAIVAARYDFRWINHQWSHEEFDFLTQKQMIREIELNLNWAADNDIPDQPEGTRHRQPLGFGQGRDRWGARRHRCRVARIRQLPRTGSVRHRRRHDAPSPSRQRVLQRRVIRRTARRVQLDLLRENCVNTPTTTCFDEELTWEHYVNNEATIMLPHVLGNDPRPHYFHQANLAEDGTFYPVVDEVLQRYNLYMSTPIIQPNYRAASDAIRRGSDWTERRARRRPTTSSAASTSRVRAPRKPRSRAQPTANSTAGNAQDGSRCGRRRRGSSISQGSAGQYPVRALPSWPTSTAVRPGRHTRYLGAAPHDTGRRETTRLALGRQIHSNPMTTKDTGTR